LKSKQTLSELQSALSLLQSQNESNKDEGASKTDEYAWKFGEKFLALREQSNRPPSLVSSLVELQITRPIELQITRPITRPIGSNLERYIRELQERRLIYKVVGRPMDVGAVGPPIKSGSVSFSVLGSGSEPRPSAPIRGVLGPQPWGAGLPARNGGNLSQQHPHRGRVDPGP
jgi:hypothetical protein